MSKITIVLMRHGQTVFNAEDKVQGWCDSFLTQEGKTMTCKRAKELLDHHYTFDGAYSSDSSRAIQTARLLSVEFNMDPDDVKLYSGMREYNYGSFEGGPNKKMYRAVVWKALFNSEYRRKVKTNDVSYFFDAVSEINSTKPSPYISETAIDFTNRLTLAVKDIAVDAYQKEKSCILVVTHGHALCALFQALAKEAYDRNFSRLPVLQNCAALVLEYDTVLETYKYIELLNSKIDA